MAPPALPLAWARVTRGPPMRRSLLLGAGGAGDRPRLRLLREEAVLRPRQPEILAQGPALIFPPEDAAALELRHHAQDDVVEPLGQIGEHDVEAVAAARLQPFLHLVGDH